MRNIQWALFVLFLVILPIGKLFSSERRSELTGHLKNIVRAKLSRSSDATAERVLQAVLRESQRHELDPLLLLAVIEHESGFHLSLRGRHGEIGLMQVKPRTARWLERQRHLKREGSATLWHPEHNIAAGAAYLAYLRQRFPDRRLYLAAYNSGPYNVKKQLKYRTVPRKYASGVLRRYQRLQGELRRGRGV